MLINLDKGVASSDHPNNQEIIWVDVDPENGHAIVQGKYKSRDTNPAENQLPVSELIGQTIKSVSCQTNHCSYTELIWDN